MADVAATDAAPQIKPGIESAKAPLPFGERQANVGKAWGEIYADPNRPQNASAEIVLRNPAVYSRDIDTLQLPNDIHAKWAELSAYSDVLAKISALNPKEWGNITGLDKLQQMVRDGNVRPDFRRTIGDVMKVSSDLFAESVQINPGKYQEYLTGNVIGAESWLERAKQPQH